MVAHTQIRCLVVAVPTAGDREMTQGALSREVLPWADPYVAGLIKKLQDEVRSERKFRSLVRNYHHAATDTADDGILFVQ